MNHREQTKSKRAVLNVGKDDEYAYWSLNPGLATPIWEKKRDQIKTHIFLTYGFESKFNWEFKCYQTMKEVAYRIKDDLEWYRSNDIEVKLNFNPEPERE